jgi:thiamine biosynthesis lipoprotein
VTTSGSYRNYVERGGKRYGHVIDPSSGKPVDNGVIAVTVVAPTAMDADGLDNALFVMGWQGSLLWLNGKKDVEAYFIYADAEGNIRDTATQGFYAMLK